MSKKYIRIIFGILMIIFLPLTYYFVQNNMLNLWIRNIIFFTLIAGYSISINFFAKDRKKK